MYVHTYNVHIGSHWDFNARETFCPISKRRISSCPYCDPRGEGGRERRFRHLHRDVLVHKTNSHPGDRAQCNLISDVSMNESEFFFVRRRRQKRRTCVTLFCSPLAFMNESFSKSFRHLSGFPDFSKRNFFIRNLRRILHHISSLASAAFASNEEIEWARRQFSGGVRVRT